MRMFGNKPHTRIDDAVRSVIQANHNAACREAAHPCGELSAVFSRHFASAGESFPGITMYMGKRSFASVATRTHLFFATRQFVSHFAKWRSVRAHPVYIPWPLVWVVGWGLALVLAGYHRVWAEAGARAAEVLMTLAQSGRLCLQGQTDSHSGYSCDQMVAKPMVSYSAADATVHPLPLISDYDTTQPGENMLEDCPIRQKNGFS